MMISIIINFRMAHVKNPPVDILTWAQTRSGLQKVRLRWADIMEDSLWASWSDILNQIVDNNTIRVPIFSLRYTWISEGKWIFPKHFWLEIRGTKYLS